MARSVYMILPPEVAMFDVAGPLEALRYAKRLGAKLSVHVCGFDGESETSLPFRLVGLEPLPEKLKPSDLVIIPGVMDEERSFNMPQTKMIVDFLIAHVYQKDQQIMSVCSGAFLLGMAGILDGRQCTTHHDWIEQLQTDFPLADVLSNRVFVEDKGVFSSAGISAGVDLILYWIEQNFGSQITLAVARNMNIYFRRSVSDPVLSPWLLGRNHLHPAIHRVQDVIVQDPSAELSLSHLAELAHVSGRHLSRLFKLHTGMTVHQYQIQLRHALFDQWRSVGYSQEKAAISAGFSSAHAWRRSRKGIDALE